MKLVLEGSKKEIERLKKFLSLFIKRRNIIIVSDNNKAKEEIPDAYVVYDNNEVKESKQIRKRGPKKKIN